MYYSHEQDKKDEWSGPMQEKRPSEFDGATQEEMQLLFNGKISKDEVLNSIKSREKNNLTTINNCDRIATSIKGHRMTINIPVGATTLKALSITKRASTTKKATTMLQSADKIHITDAELTKLSANESNILTQFLEQYKTLLEMKSELETLGALDSEGNPKGFLELISSQSEKANKTKEFISIGSKFRDTLMGTDAELTELYKVEIGDKRTGVAHQFKVSYNKLYKSIAKCYTTRSPCLKGSTGVIANKALPKISYSVFDEDFHRQKFAIGSISIRQLYEGITNGDSMNFDLSSGEVVEYKTKLAITIAKIQRDVLVYQLGARDGTTKNDASAKEKIQAFITGQVIMGHMLMMHDSKEFDYSSLDGLASAKKLDRLIKHGIILLYDGQQRIRSIQAFLNNLIPLIKQGGTIYWSQMTEEDKELFLSIEIPTTCIYFPKEETDFYKKYIGSLNYRAINGKGIPLSPAELRMASALDTAVNKLTTAVNASGVKDLLATNLTRRYTAQSAMLAAIALSLSSHVRESVDIDTYVTTTLAHKDDNPEFWDKIVSQLITLIELGNVCKVYSAPGKATQKTVLLEIWLASTLMLVQKGVLTLEDIKGNSATISDNFKNYLRLNPKAVESSVLQRYDEEEDQYVGVIPHYISNVLGSLVQLDKAQFTELLAV